MSIRGIVALSLLLLGSACIAARAQDGTGPCQSLNSIRTAVHDFLARQNSSGLRRIKIKVSSLDPRLRLAACNRPLNTFLPPGVSAIGDTTVGVRCRGIHPWSLYVPAMVQVFGKVLIAARPLGRGVPLMPADFIVSRRDVSNLTTGYVSNPQRVNGQVLREPIAAGTMLVPNMMQGRRLIHRGMPVTIIAQVGSLVVRVAGRALSGGAAGQWVRVRNSMSQKIIEGVVTRDGQVRVPM